MNRAVKPFGAFGAFGFWAATAAPPAADCHDQHESESHPGLLGLSGDVLYSPPFADPVIHSVQNAPVRKAVLIAAAAAIVVLSWWFLKGFRGPAATAPQAVHGPSAFGPSAAAPAPALIPYLEARGILDAHPADTPAALKGSPAGEAAAAWSAWVSQHDAEDPRPAGPR